MVAVSFLLKLLVGIVALVVLIPFSMLRVLLTTLDNIHDWADQLVEYEEEEPE